MAVPGKVLTFIRAVSSLYTIRNLSIILCIALLHFFWDKSYIQSLHLTVKTAMLAIPGKPENIIRHQLQVAHIPIIEKSVGYGDFHSNDRVIVCQFLSHVVLIHWGYEVIIYINPVSKKIERSVIRSFGNGL